MFGIAASENPRYLFPPGQPIVYSSNRSDFPCRTGAMSARKHLCPFGSVSFSVPSPFSLYQKATGSSACPKYFFQHSIKRSFSAMSMMPVLLFLRSL